VSGGWRERKGLPFSAKQIERTVGFAAIAGVTLFLGAWAAAGVRRR
jgi:hypothetical protein